MKKEDRVRVHRASNIPRASNNKKSDAQHQLNYQQHKKEVQTQYIAKLKESLGQRIEETIKSAKETQGVRSYGMETAYDFRTFCTPFDLRVLDKEIQNQTKERLEAAN